MCELIVCTPLVCRSRFLLWITLRTETHHRSAVHTVCLYVNLFFLVFLRFFSASEVIENSNNGGPRCSKKKEKRVPGAHYRTAKRRNVFHPIGLWIIMHTHACAWTDMGEGGEPAGLSVQITYEKKNNKKNAESVNTSSSSVGPRESFILSTTRWRRTGDKIKIKNTLKRRVKRDVLSSTFFTDEALYIKIKRTAWIKHVHSKCANEFLMYVDISVFFSGAMVQGWERG